MSLVDATDVGRCHHQLAPNLIYFEPHFDPVPHLTVVDVALKIIIISINGISVKTATVLCHVSLALRRPLIL